MPTLFTFMSVRMRLTNRQELLTAIGQASFQNPVRAATLNPEFMLEAGSNAPFRHSLEKMTHCTIDGIGLYWWLKRFANKKQLTFPLERYSGANLVQDLLHTYQNGAKSFFFLGGREGYMNKAKKEVEKQFPHIRIAGVAAGGQIDQKAVQLDPKLAEEIAACHPDILLVGFGAPKEELWIEQADRGLTVPVMIGVGGALGFYGAKKRAPEWIQRTGFEWAYRSLTEKGHWKRAWRAVILFSWKAFYWTRRAK